MRRTLSTWPALIAPRKWTGGVGREHESNISKMMRDKNWSTRGFLQVCWRRYEGRKKGPVTTTRKCNESGETRMKRCPPGQKVGIVLQKYFWTNYVCKHYDKELQGNTDLSQLVIHSFIIGQYSAFLVQLVHESTNVQIVYKRCTRRLFAVHFHVPRYTYSSLNRLLLRFP